MPSYSVTDGSNPIPSSGESRANLSSSPALAVEQTATRDRVTNLWRRIGRGSRALDINEAGTRFIPFIDPARLGVALMVGFLIRLTIGRRSARRRSLVGKPYQEFA